jgi:ankyrin repeat protein
MRKIMRLALAASILMACGSDVLQAKQGEGPRNILKVKEKREQQEQLFAAIEAGDLDKVKSLIATVGIETRDDLGTTPLSTAVIQGQFDIVKYLVGQNARLEASDNLRGTTPLIYNEPRFSDQ